MAGDEDRRVASPTLRLKIAFVVWEVWKCCLLSKGRGNSSRCRKRDVLLDIEEGRRPGNKRVTDDGAVSVGR